MLRIIDRHILKGLSVAFLIGIFALTLILLVQHLLRLLSMVMDRGVDPVTVGRVFIALLPSFLLVTIPMAMMLASVATFNRLSSENEITALRAAGVGFYRMTCPVFFFSLAAALLTLWMGLLAQPWGGSSFKSLSVDLLKKSTGLGLEAGKFNEVGSGLMIYIETLPTPSEMQGVFIHDQRKQGPPLIIVAEKGALTRHSETGMMTFELVDGSIHRTGNTPSDDQWITFSSYAFSMDPVAYLLNATVRGPTPAELKEKISRAQRDRSLDDLEALRLLTQFYKQFSFSAAALLFGLLGVPLGMIAGRTGNMSGLVLGIGVILLYYVLNMAGDYLVTRRLANPLVAAWFPHIILIPLSIALLTRNKSCARRACFE